MKTFTFTAYSSIRLDEFLRSELPAALKKSVSNSKIRRLIVSGNVTLNGKKCPVPSAALKNGSKISVFIDEEKLFFEKEAEDVDFTLTEKDVLFEDEWLLIVNKPANFPCEETFVKDRKNLHAECVRYLWEKNPSLRNPPYVGIMHRLDHVTSGVVLFTKSREINKEIHALFEDHENGMKKIYEAVVCVTEKGKKFLEKGKFTVEMNMGRISKSSDRAKWGELPATDPKGQYSKTEFEVLEIDEKNKLAKIKAILKTGRTHQIRVHLSSVGLPILGDELYGGRKFERVMLNASELIFRHPKTEEDVDIFAYNFR